MISRINISGLGPYGSDNASLDNLKSVNYIFGSNGSGKTTISEYLRTGMAGDESRVEWSGPSRPVLVYNQHYINGIFQNGSVPGVFTLGEDNIEIKQSVSALGEEINNLEKLIEGYEEVLKGEESKYSDAEELFKQKCWDVRNSLSDAQKIAFRGCLSKKESFFQRILTLDAPRDFKPLANDDLESLAKKASGVPLQQLQPITIPDFESFEQAESCEAFSRPVVGSGDVDTAKLIHELNNAGWVERGLRYFRLKERATCPFCQQQTSEILARSIENYFDDDYRGAQRLLADAVSIYETSLSEIRQLREDLSIYRNQGFDIIQVSNDLIDFDALASTNLERMKAKQNDLGSSVIIEDTIDARENLTISLERLNEQIVVHNERALHFNEFKEETNSCIRWQCVTRLDAEKRQFLKAERAYNGAKKGLESKLFSCSNAIEKRMPSGRS